MELFCFELEASHWEVLEQELGKADAVIKTLTLASIEGIMEHNRIEHWKSWKEFMRRPLVRLQRLLQLCQRLDFRWDRLVRRRPKSGRPIMICWNYSYLLLVNSYTIQFATIFLFQELACLTSEHWDVLAAELKRGGTRIKRVEASKMELNDDIFDSFFACIGAVKEAKVACKT